MPRSDHCKGPAPGPSDHLHSSARTPGYLGATKLGALPPDPRTRGQAPSPPTAASPPDPPGPTSDSPRLLPLLGPLPGPPPEGEGDLCFCQSLPEIMVSLGSTSPGSADHRLGGPPGTADGGPGTCAAHHTACPIFLPSDVNRPPSSNYVQLRRGLWRATTGFPRLENILLHMLDEHSGGLHESGSLSTDFYGNRASPEL